MTHALVTICAPITVGKIDDARRLIEAMGNPASSEISGALDRRDNDDGTHFVSMHAIPPTEPRSRHGYLLLEFSADGEDDIALPRVAKAMGDRLRPIFALARDWHEGDMTAYLKAHKITIGVGWRGRAGLAFAGTPGMSVGRVLREADLAKLVSALAGAQDGGLNALDRLDHIRQSLRNDPAYQWALETPASLPVPPSTTGLALIPPMAWSFIKTYLWPLAVPLAVVLWFGVLKAIPVFQDIAATNASDLFKAWLVIKALWSGLLWLLEVLCAFAIPVIVLLGILYASLRAKEDSDWIDDRAPRRDVLRRILERENVYAHNHMISVTTLKPGWTRKVTTRLAFWLIGGLAGLSFKPGYLGEIGTIHFARWVHLPGSRDLVFLSNYGGSWESYLEDFITKAHNGLTAVWSNTVGFPRTENLFQEGATDGERFKRYARHSMLPTSFWYSAYPTLTTANIRTNAAIRCGLGAAMTDEEANTWLALFGSATRPAEKLESSQIQSLVFGGLGFMPHGQLLLVDLCNSRPSVRAWLNEMLPDVAFDDGRRLERKAVLTLALGPNALAKAGLPADALESFPPAYLDGMTGPGRSRILGDDPADGARTWWWRADGTYDAALLVYGTDEDSAAALVTKMTSSVAKYGHALARVMPLHPIPEEKPKRLEPFGFVDGTSQPVIRGTYRGLRNPDPIHLVEPGEFILGYPDNRGNIPPGPTLRAIDDPENQLPIRCDNDAAFGSNAVDAPREIGRNGSFLVIRQLEQDHDALWTYCSQEAERLQDRLGEPYRITPEFIAAKMVGRWPDGSSLVRNPYRSFSDPDNLLEHVTTRAETRPANNAVISPPSGSSTDSHPDMKVRTPRGNPEDNNFLFGTEDPEGLRCPFGAHIRRANPRDSLDPGSKDQVAISNRHRILRVGRSYVAQEGQKSGLMFMCLNGDIERQFEFVQQTWLGSETFHGLSGERDPLAGNKAGCPVGFTVPTRDGPVRLAPMSCFVTPRGGGYFFLPGKKLLEFLCI